jgi:hypothetical protein
MFKLRCIGRLAEEPQQNNKRKQAAIDQLR